MVLQTSLASASYTSAACLAYQGQIDRELATFSNGAPRRSNQSPSRDDNGYADDYYVTQNHRNIFQNRPVHCALLAPRHLG